MASDPDTGSVTLLSLPSLQGKNLPHGPMNVQYNFYREKADLRYRYVDKIYAVHFRQNADFGSFYPNIQNYGSGSDSGSRLSTATVSKKGLHTSRSGFEGQEPDFF